MDAKEFAKFLATFAAGALANDLAKSSGRSTRTDQELLQFFALVAPLIQDLPRACRILRDKHEENAARRGAARVLLVATTATFREALLDRTVRDQVQETLASSVNDPDNDIRTSVARALQFLASWEQTPEDETLSNLRTKLSLLKAHATDAPPDRLRVYESLKEKMGYGPDVYVTNERELDFLAACRSHLISAQGDEKRWVSFLKWYAHRPDWERDLFVFLSTETDASGHTFTLPEMPAVFSDFQKREPTPPSAG